MPCPSQATSWCLHQESDPQSSCTPSTVSQTPQYAYAPLPSPSFKILTTKCLKGRIQEKVRLKRPLFRNADRAAEFREQRHSQVLHCQLPCTLPSDPQAHERMPAAQPLQMLLGACLYGHIQRRPLAWRCKILASPAVRPACLVCLQLKPTPLSLELLGTKLLCRRDTAKEETRSG